MFFPAYSPFKNKLTPQGNTPLAAASPLAAVVVYGKSKHSGSPL